jgi:hypothetical protein
VHFELLFQRRYFFALLSELSRESLVHFGLRFEGAHEVVEGENAIAAAIGADDFDAPIRFDAACAFAAAAGSARLGRWFRRSGRGWSIAGSNACDGGGRAGTRPSDIER